MSSRTRNAVEWRDPLASDKEQGGLVAKAPRNDGRRVTRPNFAPLGLVRRIVEMLLQAGISPRVGQNDMKKELTAPLGGKKVRLQMLPHLFASPSL